MKLRKNAWVVFDRDDCPKDVYEEYYKDKFEDEKGKLKLFVFLGEIVQVQGHCILADLSTGLITGMWHTENFREATEDEY